ncbi:hypothetical protein BT69DRAFT_1320234 [Atractiella rhizophila]|nr:hypothetical protein BT69DRAFT_1320234 [Atractiella rhizophila]
MSGSQSTDAFSILNKRKANELRTERRTGEESEDEWRTKIGSNAEREAKGKELNEDGRSVSANRKRSDDQKDGLNREVNGRESERQRRMEGEEREDGVESSECRFETWKAGERLVNASSTTTTPI